MLKQSSRRESEPVETTGFINITQPRLNGGIELNPMLRSAILTVLTGAALFALVTNAIPVFHMLTRVYPSNPWEAGVNIEAIRFAKGMTVYESPQTHATQMYGWMQTVVLGTLFKFVPLNNGIPRVLTFLASLSLVGVLTFALSRRTPLWFALFSFSTLFSMSALGSHYFASGRPDMTSLLFGTLGLFAAYRASPDRPRDWFLPTALILVGMSFKQTAAGFAILPALAVALSDLMDRRYKLRWAPWIPLAGVAAYILAVFFFNPFAYEYMFAGFRQYPILPERVIYGIWKFSKGSILLWALILLWTSRPTVKTSKKCLWTMVSCAGLLPLSLAAYAKLGGTSNSMMPYLLGMSFLSLLLVAELGLIDKGANAKSNALLSVVGVLWIFQTLESGPNLNRFYLLPDARQASYQKVIEAVRKLPGTVSSPEDGTLLYLAKQTVDRNLYLERDIRGIEGTEFPPDLEAYLRSADYVVDTVDSNYSEYVNPESLARRGYALMENFGEYAIWKRR